MTEWRRVDMSGWNARNLWPLPSGEIAVRPGLRKILTPSDGVGGCSTRAPGTGDVWHYVVAGTTLTIYDESLTSITTLSLGTAIKPRTVSFSVLGDQIVITSPDFATIHGYIGSGVEFARKKASANPLTTAIAIPRGLSVAWAGRLVIADGPALYFSDPGEPRTFIGQNVLIGEWSSYVYGIHVSAEGALIVATGNGIWALPEDAAAAAQIVQGVWSKITDATVLDYETTATTNGEIWALTRTGVRRVWPMGGDVIDLDEAKIPRSMGARIHFDDYREGRIYGGQDGPIVAISSSIWKHHAARKTSSWWTAPNDSTFDLRGLLYSDRGEELLLTSNRLYRVIGNFDGDEAMTSEGATAVVGYFAGRVDLGDVDETPAIREVRVAADAPARARYAVRGGSDTVINVVPQGEQNAAIIGTATWDGGADYLEQALVSLSADNVDLRSHEPSFEIGAQQPLSRLEPRARILLGGPGVTRPRNRT